MTAVSVDTIPPIGPDEARTLARTEYTRFLQQIRNLGPEHWQLQTDCTRWTVQDVAAHVVGATESFASVREFARQGRLALAVSRQEGFHFYDSVNEVQVRDRRGLSPAQLIERFNLSAPKATWTRAALPKPLRALPMPFPPPLGRRSVAYLVDRVLTRDVWMHRVDIAQAVGLDPMLTADHDGRLIADMVADWATTHSDPFVLELGGQAGGSYRRGHAGTTTTEIEAVEFVRILSGRAPGDGVLRHPLPL